MPKIKKISIFEGRGIRREWNEKEEKWYFSVVDVVAALTEQADFQAARNYWKVLKNRLNREGSETVTKCNRLKISTERVLTNGLLFAILGVAKTTRSDLFRHGGF